MTTSLDILYLILCFVGSAFLLIWVVPKAVYICFKMATLGILNARKFFEKEKNEHQK